MPAPQTNFIANTDKSGFDPATLSDDDEDDQASQTSRSTWASTSDATILGFADGYLDGDESEDWRVSRIGGLPTFPLAQPPDQANATTCQSCRNTMPLLTQIYCPLESSSLERVVYVFACPRTACRKKPGTIRAFRANRLWKDSPEEKARIQDEKKKKELKPNPVAVDLGGLVFGGAGGGGTTLNPFASTPSGTANPFAPPRAAAASTGNPFASSSSSSASALNPFASTTPDLVPSPPPVPQPLDVTSRGGGGGEVSSTWVRRGPSYPSQYITTSYEPPSPKISPRSLPPLSNLSISSSESRGTAIDEGEEEEEERYETRREGKGSGGRTKKGSGRGKGRPDGSGSSGGGGGAGGAGQQGEGYEVQRVKGVDQVFLRFQERVSREGAQVVRYEHNSQPLAFSASSTAYKTLYPTASGDPGGGGGELGTYNPQRLPTCRSCRGRTVFEYQLMPNLISILNRTQGTKGTSAYAAGDTTEKEGGGGEGGKGEKEEGLDWATVWVFTCGTECVDQEDKNWDRETWKEESVMVEWEE